MNQAFLLIGGNEGDRVANMERARNSIRQYCGPVILESSLYETAAWGNIRQPPFLNQALMIHTALDAEQLLSVILATEERLGRKRAIKYGPRTIDIDILFFNQEIYNLPELIIPHPEIANRRFALTPLSEIAPGWQHPVLHQTIKKLLADCKDPLDVRKL